MTRRGGKNRSDQAEQMMTDLLLIADEGVNEYKRQNSKWVRVDTHNEAGKVRAER